MTVPSQYNRFAAAEQSAIPALVCVGISHRSAPLEFRERIAARDANPQVPSELSDLTGEWLVLSTCNRFEAFAVARPGIEPELLRERLTLWFADALKLKEVETSSLVYHHTGIIAVRHVARVAAGLDSLVLGEHEILGQVSHALREAQEAGTTGDLLDAVFRTAIKAGRRARAESAIARAPISVSSEVVRLTGDLVDPLENARVLLVGTGPMGQQAGAALRERGVQHLEIASRTSCRAVALAEQLGATSVEWDDMPHALARADVVLCATGAPHAVITAQMLRAARSAPNGHQPSPLLLLDIAAPRDVEPGAREIAGVRVFDLDDLKDRLADGAAARTREIPRVQQIIEEEIERFEAWARAASLRPLFAAVREHAEGIRKAEVARVLRQGADLSPKTRELLEHLSSALVTKLLHGPTRRMRSETDEERRRLYEDLVLELFELDGDADETERRAG